MGKGPTDMKTIILILVVATTGLAVASVQFAQRASSEKQRADTEVALRQKQEARLQQLEQAQAGLEQQLTQAQLPRTDATPVAPPRMASHPLAPPTARFEGAQADASSAGFAVTRRPWTTRGPMESEAGQKYIRTQMRANIRRLYGDVGRELNLTQEQADALINLMAEQQTRGFGDRRQAALADPASAQQTWRDLQAKNNQEIAALIGQDKMSEWKQFQQTLPQRSEVDVIRQQLDQAGVPLSADQRSELVNVMVEEIQRNPRPTVAQGMMPEDSFKQQNEWQDAYDKSVSDRAKQVLSSEQYDRYSEYRAWMTEMRRNMPVQMDGRAVRFSASGGGAVATAIMPVFPGGPVAAVELGAAPAPAQPGK